jgi:hypothetical protein
MALVANITLVVLSLLMGLRLLRQYTTRPKSHTLWYAVGLLLTALASTPEVYRGLTGSLPTVLWWVYWIAASALVGFLAVGTAYMIAPTWGKVALIAATALTAWLIIATVTSAGPAPAVFTETTFAKAPNWIVKLPFLIQDIAGAMFILGGALWTFYKIRSWFAVWIGLGTCLFAAGGASAGLLKFSELFYFTQTAGIIVLYLGISMSIAPKAVKPTALQS